MGTFFLKGVGLTKASVDHPSIMIRGQETMPSIGDMWGLRLGAVFWKVCIGMKGGIDVQRAP